MRVSTLTAAAVLAFATASAPVFAQTGSTSNPSSSMQATVTDTSLAGEPSAESPDAARHEAAAAWAEAQRSCRQESGREAQRECLRSARDDYNHLMAIARGGSGTR